MAQTFPDPHWRYHAPLLLPTSVCIFQDCSHTSAAWLSTSEPNVYSYSNFIICLIMLFAFTFFQSKIWLKILQCIRSDIFCLELSFLLSWSWHLWRGEAWYFVDQLSIWVSYDISTWLDTDCRFLANSSTMMLPFLEQIRKLLSPTLVLLITWQSHESGVCQVSPP